jgi:Asp-tRNA(Asn)/Glu-tRNA(Gln) amidotransferase A subunit family amidase
LTRAFLNRIGRYEEYYNAIISLNPDALDIAAELDAEYRLSGPRGPLHGVPIVIKDNIDYGGLVTTAGYSGFSTATGGVDMIPTHDAVVVERLRDAGAVILAKTNMPDFAGHGTRTESTVAGVTLNPYNVKKAPGGSSGGTATAVNASFAVAGLGTETGGSIQNPSAAQALVGVKPTFGLIPMQGIVPMSAGADVVGPMARTVHDAAILLDVMVGSGPERSNPEVPEMPVRGEGYTDGLSQHALEGRRFGLVGEGWRTSYLPLAPDTEELYRQAIATLEAQGAEVLEDPFLGSGFIEKYRERRGSRSEGEDAMARYLRGLGEAALFTSIEEWEELSGREFRRGRGRGRFRDGADSAATAETQYFARADTPAEYRSFVEWRIEIQSFFRRILEQNDLDGLFFPQAGAPIPDLVEDPKRPEYSPNNHPELPSNVVNDIGLPVVTVPYAYYQDGTPFVLAFIGDLWTEGELLAYAYDLEQASKGRRPPRLVERDGGDG